MSAPAHTAAGETGYDQVLSFTIPDRNARGRVFVPMPFRLVDYWSMTNQADLSAYRAGSAERGADAGASAAAG